MTTLQTAPQWLATAVVKVLYPFCPSCLCCSGRLDVCRGICISCLSRNSHTNISMITFDKFVTGHTCAYVCILKARKGLATWYTHQSLYACMFHGTLKQATCELYCTAAAAVYAGAPVTRGSDWGSARTTRGVACHLEASPHSLASCSARRGVGWCRSWHSFTEKRQWRMVDKSVYTPRSSGTPDQMVYTDAQTLSPTPPSTHTCYLPHIQSQHSLLYL